MTRPRLRAVLVATVVAVGLVVPPTSASGQTSSSVGATARTTSSTATTFWRLTGSGWGHGVGMSQYGARQMAVEGFTARQILAHYYTGTAYTAVPDTARVSVNLQHRVASTTLTPSALATGGGRLTLVVGSKTLVATAGETATVRPTSTGVSVSCAACSGGTSATGTSASATWDDGRTLLSVAGTRYRDGSLLVSRASGSTSLEVVARVRLHDEYLDYVREVPWSWPSAALQAQAAAARAYALRAVRSGVKSSCACHVYDTTTSQVFGGYPSGAEATAWSRWTAAVRATGSTGTGYVPTYGGAVIEAVYSSSTWGRTQNSEDVWGTAVPYLRSVDDHWSLTAANPRASWEATPSNAAVAAAFRLPDVVRLDLSSRYVSGGIRAATATASNGTTATLAGATFAARLGLSSTFVGRPVRRLAGDDVWSVAASVARSRYAGASTVVVASGESVGRADVAVSGPLSQSLRAPLLLAQRTRLTNATKAELDRRGSEVKNAVVVGNGTSLATDVVRELQARGLRVTRITGVDRYALSAAVARRMAAERPVRAVVVASGAVLTDAIGAVGPGGSLGEPLLFATKSTLPAPVAAAVDDLGVQAARVVGPTTSVSDAVVDDLVRRVDLVDRIAGTDRYAQAAALGRYYTRLLPGVTVVSLAPGADASLTQAFVAGAAGRITLLTTTSGLPAASARALQEAPVLARVDAVGGPGTVPSAVVKAASRA